MADHEEPTASAEEMYSSLRHLIPQLAQELDGLRASLREHNVWLQRYGSAPEAPHTAFSSVSPYNPGASSTVPTASTGNYDAATSSKSPPNYLASASSSSLSAVQPTAENPSNLLPPTHPTAASSSSSLPKTANAASSALPPPEYLTSTPASASVSSAASSLAQSRPPALQSTSSSSAGSQAVPSPADHDTPPSYGNTSPPPPPFLPPPPSREEMMERRDQTAEWLREGEDVLREYSARFAQLGTQLQRPFEDVLGTWVESHPDNALPDYEKVEEREELMVGGVGEVPPPYLGGAARRTAEVEGGVAEARGSISSDNEEDTVDEDQTDIYGDERDVINQQRR